MQRLWVQFPGNTYWQYKCIAWMHCKSLWIKASAKCINVRMSRGANNWVQHVFEKKHLFYNDISSHFKLLLSNERLDFCDSKKLKIKRIKNADSFSHHSLIIFTKGADIFDHDCIYIYIYIYIYIDTFKNTKVIQMSKTQTKWLKLLKTQFEQNYNRISIMLKSGPLNINKYNFWFELCISKTNCN